MCKATQSNPIDFRHCTQSSARLEHGLVVGPEHEKRRALETGDFPNFFALIFGLANREAKKS